MRRSHELTRQRCLTRLLKGRGAAAVRREFESYLRARNIAESALDVRVAGMYDGVARLVELWRSDQATLQQLRGRARAGMRHARNLRDAACFIAAQSNTVFQRQRWVTAAGPEPLMFWTPGSVGHGRNASEILGHLAAHAELEFNPYYGRPQSLQRFLILCLDQQLRVPAARRRRLSPNKLIAAIVSLVLGKNLSGDEVARVIGPSRRRHYARN